MHRSVWNQIQGCPNALSSLFNIGKLPLLQQQRSMVVLQQKLPIQAFRHILHHCIRQTLLPSSLLSLPPIRHCLSFHSSSLSPSLPPSLPPSLLRHCSRRPPIIASATSSIIAPVTLLPSSQLSMPASLYPSLSLSFRLRSSSPSPSLPPALPPLLHPGITCHCPATMSVIVSAISFIVFVTVYVTAFVIASASSSVTAPVTASVTRPCLILSPTHCV